MSQSSGLCGCTRAHERMCVCPLAEAQILVGEEEHIRRPWGGQESGL